MGKLELGEWGGLCELGWRGLGQGDHEEACVGQEITD